MNIFTSNGILEYDFEPCLRVDNVEIISRKNLMLGIKMSPEVFKNIVDNPVSIDSNLVAVLEDTFKKITKFLDYGQNGIKISDVIKKIIFFKCTGISSFTSLSTLGLLYINVESLDYQNLEYDILKCAFQTLFFQVTIDRSAFFKIEVVNGKLLFCNRTKAQTNFIYSCLMRLFTAVMTFEYEIFFDINPSPFSREIQSSVLDNLPLINLPELYTDYGFQLYSALKNSFQMHLTNK